VRAFVSPKRSSCVLAGLFAALLGNAAAAQTGPHALKQEFDILFAQTLRNPADLDASFRFAEVATKLGDYEAAIGALERMLFYNPNLPRVRLELGILYMKLGSFEMAKSYLNTAISAPDVPPDVRDRLNTFLVEVDRRLEVNQFSFFGQMGLRYQTNANASPSTMLVKALGQDAFLDRQYAQKPDWNSFALGGFRWVADLGTQRGDTWETNAYFYGARQFDLGRFNLALAEIQSGPRLPVAPETLPGLTFRPYGIANVVSLANAPYQTTGGAGAALNWRLWGADMEVSVEWRNRNYRNSRTYPLSSEQSGDLVLAAFSTAGVLAPGWRWQTRAFYGNANAKANYYAYQQGGFEILLPYEFDVEVAAWGYAKRWTLTPSFGFAYTQYDAPNWLIDPYRARVDKEWRVGAILDMPINKWLGIGLQVSYLRDVANIPNYSLRDFVVSGGPTFRF
jgi:tetratricopeptide (TPR) repeat protein